jgi:hypothetical protein
MTESVEIVAIDPKTDRPFPAWLDDDALERYLLAGMACQFKSGESATAARLGATCRNASIRGTYRSLTGRKRIGGQRTLR